MKHFDSWVIEINKCQVVQLLKDEVTRVEQDVTALVFPDTVQKHLKRDAVVEIFARVQFETQIHANFVKGIENRFPALGQFLESGLNQTARTLRPGIDVGPS